MYRGHREPARHGRARPARRTSTSSSRSCATPGPTTTTSSCTTSTPTRPVRTATAPARSPRSRRSTRSSPSCAALGPDVIAVTGDHSTPSQLAAHSWHPVPTLLWSAHCGRDDVTHFGERWCLPRRPRHPARPRTSWRSCSPTPAACRSTAPDPFARPRSWHAELPIRSFNVPRNRHGGRTCHTHVMVFGRWQAVARRADATGRASAWTAARVARPSTNGMTPRMIQRRLDAGRLVTVHDAVYRVGGSVPLDSPSNDWPPSSPWDQWQPHHTGRPQSCTACGPRRCWRSRSPATRDQSPELAGVVVHRCRSPRRAGSRQSTTCRVPTVPRTLVDLGAVLSAGQRRPLSGSGARPWSRLGIAGRERSPARRSAGASRSRVVIRRVLAPHLATEPVAGVFEARMSRVLAQQDAPASRSRVRRCGTKAGPSSRGSTSPIPNSAWQSRSTASGALEYRGFRRDRPRQNAHVTAGSTVLRFTGPRSTRVRRRSAGPFELRVDDSRPDRGFLAR